MATFHIKDQLGKIGSISSASKQWTKSSSALWAHEMICGVCMENSATNARAQAAEQHTLPI
jgi:hypothetical protein